jgi:hypothetical protein
MKEHDHTTEERITVQPRSVGRRWIWLVLAILVFGVLMGIRDDFHSVWIRALLAGCAFAILAGTVQWLRRVCG